MRCEICNVQPATVGFRCLECERRSLDRHEAVVELAGRLRVAIARREDTAVGEDDTGSWAEYCVNEAAALLDAAEIHRMNRVPAAPEEPEEEEEPEPPAEPPKKGPKSFWT